MSVNIIKAGRIVRTSKNLRGVLDYARVSPVRRGSASLLASFCASRVHGLEGTVRRNTKQRLVYVEYPGGTRMGCFHTPP